MLKRLAFDNLVLVAQYALTAVLPILLVPHIVRAIGLTSFGSLTVAFSWASYSSVVVQYAFNLTGPQQLASRPKDHDEAEVVSQILSAKVTLLGVVFILTSAGGVLTLITRHDGSLGQVVVLIAMPAAAALNSSWYLQATGHFVTAALMSIVGVAAALGVAFGLVHANGANAQLTAAMALVTAPLVTGTGTLLASIVVLRRKRLRLQWRHPSDELRNGWSLFASQLVATLYGMSGPLVVGIFAGLEEAGALGSIERVINAIATLCLLTHTAAYPRLARLYPADRRTYLRLIRTVLTAQLAAGLCAAAILTFERERALRYILGAHAQGHELLLAIALFWILLSTFGSVLTGYLTVSGRARSVLPLNLKILVVSIVVGVPAVITYGAAGWLAALACSQVFVLATGWFAWRAEKQNP